MSLITLKCDSSPWANRFIDGNRGNHSAGFTAGNILQLVFPTVPLPPPDPTLPSQAVPPYSLPEHSASAFAIYLTSVSSYGRGGEEPSSAFNDRSPAYVKELSGIVLPILLRYHLFSKDGTTNTQGAPLGHLKLHQLMAPDASTLLEIPQLPPSPLPVLLLRSLRHSFVLCQNYLGPLLSYAQNLRLAHQGYSPRPTAPPRSNIPIVYQPFSHHPAFAQLLPARSTDSDLRLQD